MHLTRLCHIYSCDAQGNASSLSLIKKLMSNLSLIFTNINENVNQMNSTDDIVSWNNPLNTIIVLLTKANEVPLDQWCDADNQQIDYLIRSAINQPISYQELINFINTSPVNNKLLLVFTEIIVEDLTKIQSKKTTMNNVFKVVHDHLYITTMALINANITTIKIMDDQLYACINSWITCVSVFRNISPHGNMNLNEMFESLIKLLCGSSNSSNNFINADKIIGLFANVFANDPTLISYELRCQLEGVMLGISKSSTPIHYDTTWMHSYMNHLVTNEMTAELKEVAICIVDFLQISTLDVCNKLFTNITQEPNSQETVQKYIKVLLQLTNFPLHPVIEEFFSVKMIDFWLDLADCYSNLSQETLSNNAAFLSGEIFQQVVQIYLPKISLMNEQKILTEDGEDSSFHEFEDFRSAATDLIESLWSVLGNAKLTNILIEGVSSTDATGSNVDLFQIEAMSFLLNSLLADMTLQESPWICEVIGSNKSFIQNIIILLQSGLQSGSNNIVENHLKLDFIRTSTTLIGSMAGYFLHDSSQLNECVQVLFQGLEHSNTSKIEDKESNEKVETFIIKSIYNIFEVCKMKLASHIDYFLEVLCSALKFDSSVSSFTKGKLTRSVGFIIQVKLEDGPQKQSEYLLLIINTIAEGIAETKQLPIQNQADVAHGLLSCLSELSSAMIQSEDVEEVMLPILHQYQEYWNQDPMHIKTLVIELLNSVLSNPNYGQNSRFVEVSCLILGKALTLPPDELYFLKFSMQELIQFIMKHLPSIEFSTSFPFFTYLLEKMINCFKDQISSNDIEFLFEKIFLAYYQQYIEKDPDLLQSVVNFVNSVLDAKPSLIIYTKNWTSFILPGFMKLLTAKEKFTIFATTKFWTKVINNKRYTQQDLEVTKSQIILVGQDLTYHAMYALYHTQRSDINSYTDLLRALTAKFPMESKTWLLNALPKISNNPRSHEKLISKLSITRGSRAASNVLLEWWLECNSLPPL